MEVLNTRAKRLAATLALAGALLIPFSGAAQAPAPSGTPAPSGAPAGPAIAGTSLLANSRISAIKLSFPPGAREALHNHPFDIVVIQLTPGEVELELDGKKSVGHVEAGHVTYVPAQMQHTAGNSGTTPFDMVVVALR